MRKRVRAVGVVGGDGRVVDGGGEFLGIRGRGVALRAMLLGMMLLLERGVEIVDAGVAVIVVGVVGSGGLLVGRVGEWLGVGLRGGNGRAGVGDVLIGRWWRSCCSVDED